MLRPLLLALLVAAARVGAQPAGVPAAPLGDFDAQSDVGTVRRAGSATYDARYGEYVIAGSGQNMWAGRDDFHYVWRRLTGDFILTARARLVGVGVEAHRKLGWSVRASLATDAPHVTAAVHGDGLTSLQFRRVAGGTTEEQRSAVSAPAVIQLERRGGTYFMSVARYGDTLSTVQVSGVSLGDTVYVGLFVCAHNDTVVERGAFSNVRVTKPARPDFTPYRDYIGASLELLDVAMGERTVVYRSTSALQAPNWTRDGKALIYNDGGRLYRFDLATRTPQVIETGFATRNNNDHVLSFDGKTLGISHQPPEDSGRSIVYTVPAAGGTPKRITALGPSYMHGWSPDGKFLVYTAQRGGEFDVYRAPAAGGDEVRLTTAKGLDDGPEYTPDGRWIYFNSARTGRMQIWRMRPDGSGQQPVTDDGFNNWFPHVSPDGKWIVFLSFLPDVSPSDHPWYKHVYIRLMPAEGGAPRVLAYVYGGQGTINVPSWSPDSKRIAFVSNSDALR
jgi:TolB protein